MGKKTPLYDEHLNMGAKMVDFGGWDMPLHYGSQIEEHKQVRSFAGMFDVSHMTILELNGEKVQDFLRVLLANNIDKLRRPGKAIYSCMLNPQGGIIDDLIAYWIDDEHYRLVTNAGTHDKDLAWIKQQAEAFGVSVTEREDVALIAVQGLQARCKVHEVLPDPGWEDAADLTPFEAVEVDDMFVSRTGYTGEDGYEIMLPAARAAAVWRTLHKLGVAPIGLGARDTLRLEAGLCLYGGDMDETTTPLESALNWTVAWEPADRRFIGRAAIEAQRKAGVARKLVGLILNERGVLRNHQKVFSNDAEVGEITSGSFSPTIGKAIALARVDIAVEEECQVDMRGKRYDVKVVRPPFVKKGKAVYQ